MIWLPTIKYDHFLASGSNFPAKGVDSGIQQNLRKKFIKLTRFQIVLLTELYLMIYPWLSQQKTGEEKIANWILYNKREPFGRTPTRSSEFITSADDNHRFITKQRIEQTSIAYKKEPQTKLNETNL